MNLGTVLYLPPHGRFNSDQFADNLGRYKTRYPVMILTDDSTWNNSRVIGNPEQVGRRPAYAINNYCWFKSLELARDAGLQAFIYLESDCRVGCDWWDQRLFDEYFQRYPNGVTAAGSPVCWDVISGGREFAKRVIADAHAYQVASGLPASFHGGKHPHDQSGSCYYPNGACAIYDAPAMLKLFAGFTSDIIWNARNLVAWDMEIGRRLWHNYGADCVNHVGWLALAYSGFGNAVTTEAERWEMLKSGQKVVAHQFKEA